MRLLKFSNPSFGHVNLSVCIAEGGCSPLGRTRGNRVNSLPVGQLGTAELYRLRSFHITGNNRVVNCGDSFIPLGGGDRSPGSASSPFNSRSPNSERYGCYFLFSGAL
jgi:hypothetical protein